MAHFIQCSCEGVIQYGRLRTNDPINIDLVSSVEKYVDDNKYMIKFHGPNHIWKYDSYDEKKWIADYERIVNNNFK